MQTLAVASSSRARLDAVPLREGLLVLALVVLALAPYLFTGDLATHRIDLGVYREGGASVLDGRRLYGPEFGRDLLPPLPFTYPPLAALLGTALVPLPARVADVAWTTASLAVVVAVLALSFRALLVRAGRRAGLVLLGLASAAVWTTPINDHLGFGQVNLFLLALVLADVLPRQTRLPRGVLVGLATAIKLVPGIFVLHLVVTGRWRAARTAVLTAVGLSLLTAAVLPADSRRFWTTTLFDAGRIGDNPFSNQSVRGALQRVVPEAAVGPCWLVLAGLVLVLGLRRARAAHLAGDPLLAVTLTGLTGVLVSPISWIHHLVWLLPALGLLVGDGRDRRRVLMAAAAVVALWARLPYLGQDLLDAGGPALLAEPLRSAYGLLCLALLLALPRLVRPPAPAPAEKPPLGDPRRLSLRFAGRIGADQLTEGGGAWRALRRATRAAWTPAPYPLSMLTTTTPGAQDDSMAASAAKPPAATP